MNEIRRTKNKQFEVIAKSKNFLTDYVILCSGVIGTNSLFLGKHVGNIDDNYLREHNVGLSVKSLQCTGQRPLLQIIWSLNELNEQFLESFIF